MAGSAQTKASPRRATRIVRPASAPARARNRRIQAVIRPDTPGKLPFTCECGMGHCNDSVWLTLPEASDLMERGGFIIGDHFIREARDRVR